MAKNRLIMKYFVAFIFCFGTLSLMAQEMSWKKHGKEADKLYNQAKYAAAAEHYQKAWEKKPSKKEMIFKAGEAYYAIRDYRKAAEAYKEVKDDSNNFALAGLNYGRSLKQDGQYIKAKKALHDFIQSYQKADKAVVKRIVDNELKGCDLALQLQENPVDDQWTIEPLAESINSPSADFAPLPFSEDILYFSSNVNGEAKIYRTQRVSGVWSSPVEPSLPKMAGHVCNGSFSPDHERFYYTICESEKAWDGPKSKCDIYLTVRKSNSWSNPVKLRDYVRMDGTTATHPHTVYNGKIEILYFVSDRPGGKGGLDIWYMTRPIDSEDIDFSLPRNAGKRINTLGDEVSPFYDKKNETLYFSSNGRVGIGGQDIYKAKGARSKWEEAEHLGLPINSSADDYYYQFFESTANAYLVSNRLLGLDKIDSTNEDIFSIATPEKAILVKGAVYDQLSKDAISNIVVNLYELKEDGQQRLLNSKTFDNENYAFELIANRNLRITVEKDGYSTAAYDFNTYNYNLAKGYGKDLFLSTATASTSTQPVFKAKPPKNISTSTVQSKPPTRKPTTTVITTTPPVRNTPPVVNTRPSSPPPPKITTPQTPTYQGVYFKVQLTVVIDFYPDHSSYNRVKEMGRLDTEYLAEKNWTRVLLADFFTLGDARNAMLKAHQMGYPDAFLVKYRNGRRVTP